MFNYVLIVTQGCTGCQGSCWSTRQGLRDGMGSREKGEEVLSRKGSASACPPRGSVMGPEVAVG